MHRYGNGWVCKGVLNGVARVHEGGHGRIGARRDRNSAILIFVDTFHSVCLRAVKNALSNTNCDTRIRKKEYWFE